MTLEQKILSYYNTDHRSVKEERMLDILKVILVDKETDINDVINKASTTLNTLKKYIEDDELILKYLTPRELKIFKERANYVLDYKNRNKQYDLPVLRKIIDDIFNTRHTVEQICMNNYYSLERFKYYLSQTNYIDEFFGEGRQELIRKKIKENGMDRERVPRNSILIEDRIDVYVAKEDLLYLNETDYKKLRFASNYICSGANMDFVSNKFKVDSVSIISILSEQRLEEILKSTQYKNLTNYIGIEKMLINNQLSLKKQFLTEMVDMLKETNYDYFMLFNYYSLPVPLLNKVLNEILVLPFFDEDVKVNIRSMLNKQEEKQRRR